MSTDAAPRMTLLDAAAKRLTLLFATTVREIRNSTGASQLGLVMNILKTLAFVAVFYLLFVVVGRRDAGLRGDTMLFLLSGVLLFRLHSDTVGRVRGAVSGNRALINYEPAKSIIFVWARALAALYEIFLVSILMLGVYALATGGVEIHRASHLIAPVLLAWTAGVGVGMILMYAEAHLSWFPLIGQFYQRIVMFTSGKFFVANAIPSVALPYLFWNPLFHAIDIARGALFVNYEPRNTSLEFLAGLTLGLLVIGHIMEARLNRGMNHQRS